MCRFKFFCMNNDQCKAQKRISECWNFFLPFAFTQTNTLLQSGTTLQCNTSFTACEHNRLMSHNTFTFNVYSLAWVSCFAKVTCSQLTTHSAFTVYRVNFTCGINPFYGLAICDWRLHCTEQRKFKTHSPYKYSWSNAILKQLTYQLCMHPML